MYPNANPKNLKSPKNPYANSKGNPTKQYSIKSQKAVKTTKKKGSARSMETKNKTLKYIPRKKILAPIYLIIKHSH